MAGKAARLARHVVVQRTAYAPGDKPTAAHAKLITNPKAWDGGKPPSAGDDSGSGGYESLKLDELKAEIATRNAGRSDEDQILANGNKADLVAALEADDDASADS